MPASLQGLNLVYPPPPLSDSTGADILTPPPGFPDLSAQLDLWTNLSFASDEPFIPKDRTEPEALTPSDQKLPSGGDTQDHPESNLIAPQDISVPSTIDNILSNSTNDGPISFDFGTFLAGFGIDPFLVPPQPSLPPRSSPMTAPTTPHSPSDTSSNARSSLDSDGQPPHKRTRTRKDSTASQTPVIAPSVQQHRSLSSDARAVSEFSEDHDPFTTPLTAAEDKRRRNTAASARFRAKKKEREQALERRSRELEAKVTELERECEGLRRENGWLKGLVVGVTGGNPSSVSSAPADSGGPEEEKSSGKRKQETGSDSRLAKA